MILDAVLLSLAKIASDTSGPLDVAIFPEMRVIPTNGVQIINHLSGYKVWLSGSVNYAIIQYKNEEENKSVVGSCCLSF